MSFFSHQWCSLFLLSVILGLCGCDAASVQEHKRKAQKK